MGSQYNLQINFLEFKGGKRGEVEGRLKREWICVYTELIHFVIQQNLAW